ncbi:terpenoid synthase [Schizopora paradoxa]|uniref:Terpene synthase n=1 Tax=Schizopora paradoxa TaxID=27342 RepID=A0A0H2RV34_9AGAM|nr:terpenoid synthase [Schizopora paradoxa]
MKTNVKLEMLELFNSYMFPEAGLEELRMCCDCINALTALDDITDAQNGEDAQQSTNTFLAAILEKPSTVTSIYQMASQLRETITRKAPADCMRRFVEQCEKYCAAVVKEAELRDRGLTLDKESFTNFWREFSATQLVAGLVQCAHDIDLPDDVFDNDVFRLVYWAGVDMLCLSNDLYSYNREQAKGVTGNKMITVVIKERGYTLQQAADFIGEEHQRLVAQMADTSATMPSFGAKVDGDVQKYIRAMERCVAGNIIWSLETPRYFGVRSAPLQRDKIVELWDVEGLSGGIET